jgi:putative hydrolase of HD superfamily
MQRLRRQMEFLLELDKLKSVFRRNYLADGSRLENDAEHSWSFSMAAMVLAEHAAEPVDVARVVRMALVHDVVEIDAGDTFIYDESAKQGQAEREARAAARLFGLLPEDQARELLALWREFEERATPESRYARAIDRIVAVILNYASQGKTWKQHRIPKQQILAINEQIAAGSPVLWDHVRELIEDAARRGFIDG